MSWCLAHFVDVWADTASFSRVWVWNLLSYLCGAPSLMTGRVCPCVSFVSESESLYGWQSVSLGVEPTLWTFHEILLPFQEFVSGICCPFSVGLPLWGEAGSVLVCPLYQSQSHFTADRQTVSMSWCRAHFVDVWPDMASFSRVWVWNLLFCLCGAPSLTRGQVCPL
jgi:hypothetical protein